MFFTNEKEKILKQQNVDLQLQIDELELDRRKLAGHLAISEENSEWNGDLYEEEKKEHMETHKRLLELRDQSVELEHANNVIERLNKDKEALVVDKDSLHKELQTAKELKEKFETENTVLKSANKVLSEVNTKVQPIMDENIKLKSQLEYNVALLSSKDNIISDLKKQLRDNEQERVNLLHTIVTFQTKDAQVVQPQVIQPSIIEPTVLSSKK